MLVSDFSASANGPAILGLKPPPPAMQAAHSDDVSDERIAGGTGRNHDAPIPRAGTREFPFMEYNSPPIHRYYSS